MKMTNKIFLVLAGAALLFNSCTEDQLTAQPEGGTVIDDQYDEINGLDPEGNMAAVVNGMYAWFTASNTMNLTSLQHSDYGYPAFTLASELWGQDMTQYSQGYNWNWGDLAYTNRGYNQQDMFFHWNFFYQMVDKANEALRKIDPALEGAEAYQGAAKAIRAFAYFNLVQLYQHTYKGHETAAGVPIILENTTAIEAGNNPRASVQQVYDLIVADLKDAVAKLEGYNRVGKHEVDQQVAKGILARVYLTTENWSEAAKLAREAHQGYYPMDAATYNNEITGFNEIRNTAWMWGIDVTETNDVVLTGICNYPSFLCSTADGYVLAGNMFKCISSYLYNQIPDTDFRKNAFNGPDWADAGGYTKILSPYANLKFRPYQGTFLTSTNANDFPLMRVEEMYLIEAEATAMGGNPAQGKTLLEEFVKTYRNPAYTTTATTAQEVQDAVWLQRRIELWGEGFAWFDLKRLKKPSIRQFPGTNFDGTIKYDLPAEHGLFLLRIPLAEINVNQGIPENANNPIATPPPIP